ncbi:MAG: hypothetical protein ABEJ22_05600 [Haloferacaceae archaeon]
MSLEVEVPDPPDLTNRGPPEQFDAVESIESGLFRREELESALRDGAWQEAFDEWAEYTDLTEAQFEAVRERGLFREYDFFWDPDEERLRFVSPTVPEDDVGALDDGTIDGALSDLGHTVLEMLQGLYAEYWDHDTEDIVWSEQTFGQTRGEEEDRL